MNTKHSDDPSKTVNSITKEKKCQLCGLAFSTSKALNAHLSDHKLFEGIVHEEGTKHVVSGQPENNISTNGPNITKNLASLFVPGVSINLGSQGEMSVSQVLDMSYKNMMQAGPDKQQESIHLDEGEIEKDTSKTNMVKTAVTSVQNILDRMIEYSNSPSENEEEDILNDEIDTSNVGIDSIAAGEGINIGGILHVKPEIQDDCINDEIEIVVDDYDADTDVEDYNYVFSVTDNTNSDIIQKKIDELTTTTSETIICDFQGSKKTDENHEENPDFETKVDKVSRRKATKPRKKVQKKEVSKQVEVEGQDSDDLNVENEEKNQRSKEKLKPKTKNDDESLDLVSLKCLLCGKSFAKKITLKMHMNIHRGTYTCKICGKCFATNNSLKAHVDNHEGRKVKTAVCNVCDKVFYDASSVNKHVKTVHMDYRPYSCTECDQRFSETKTLNEHMRVHTGERPFACEVKLMIFTAFHT